MSYTCSLCMSISQVPAHMSCTSWGAVWKNVHEERRAAHIMPYSKLVYQRKETAAHQAIVALLKSVGDRGSIVTFKEQG
ncbi:hypothetical protein DUNSADRAFT_12038 [Dunaliella salina]|uniref:Encoded protein n=1 Tax=Dunaliella salina TaxID=3046 RepID=A0ABQ7FSU4_DUNSA|nr:hypothetical protein DUNSADRAFT_12038 [Dunaliella salina]|eukprot:KAF5825295.1 hypothetical protein DUNSADRAFT_12038 [Dunaliella salina]